MTKNDTPQIPLIFETRPDNQLETLTAFRFSKDLLNGNRIMFANAFGHAQFR